MIGKLTNMKLKIVTVPELPNAYILELTGKMVPGADLRDIIAEIKFPYRSKVNQIYING